MHGPTRRLEPQVEPLAPGVRGPVGQPHLSGFVLEPHGDQQSLAGTSLERRYVQVDPVTVSVDLHVLLSGEARIRFLLPACAGLRAAAAPDRKAQTQEREPAPEDTASPTPHGRGNGRRQAGFGGATPTPGQSTRFVPTCSQPAAPSPTAASPTAASPTAAPGAPGGSRSTSGSRRWRRRWTSHPQMGDPGVLSMS